MRQRLIAWLVASTSQRARLRLMAAVTISCGAVFSYVSTRNLAEHFGFGWLSWLFPLCLDATAAVGMELWLSRSPAQLSAIVLALSAITLSLAANVADWRLAQNNWGSAVLGAVPPAMLAAQLWVLHQHSSGKPRRRTTARRTTARPTTDARSRTTVRRGTGPKPLVPDAVLLDQMRQFEQTKGIRLSKRRIMKRYNVGDDRALRLLKDLHPETPAPVNGTVVH